MDRRQWDAQFEHLRPRFEVVRFEPRNSGRSEVARGAYSDSEDLAAVLDALGLPRVVLVGLSSGGGIAIDFALTWPERVRGLVLAAPFVQGFEMSDNQANAGHMSNMENPHDFNRVLAEFLSRHACAPG